MPLSTIIKKECSVCGKVAVEKDRIEFGDYKLITLICGHTTTEDVLGISDYNSIISSDGRKLMPFQIEGVKFAELSNARCLIGDEQGLGKTVQACALLKLHLAELSPTLVLTKTTIKLQWMWEIFRWVGTKKVQVIQSSKEMAIPGFDVYVVTYDLIKNEHMFDHVSIKTIIVDECQAIKNHLSGRAKAVQRFAKDAEHIIALSGTPIKNHAGEYFTILNILQPSRFATYQGFLDRFCDNYWNGYGAKVGGLSNPELFRDMTGDFIIRRTKAEVLPDLPSLSRNFHHVELNKKFNNAYKAASKELEDIFYAEENEDSMTSIIAIMTKMRQITGLSKVTECIDFVSDHLNSTDRKIVVFVHHHSVADLLNETLKQYTAVLNLHAGLNGDKRAELVQEFKDNSSARVLIASTLAAGEGLNLQFCSDGVVLERQWNPANEEQAEARFHRYGQVNPVNITYMIASETIDEYFTELVESKRAIVANTLDGKEVVWEESSLMKELASVLVSKGAKKWTL